MFYKDTLGIRAGAKGVSSADPRFRRDGGANSTGGGGGANTQFCQNFLKNARHRKKLDAWGRPCQWRGRCFSISTVSELPEGGV